MKHIWWYGLITLLLCNCGTTSSKPPSELENISFVDADVFDNQLLELMSADTNNIVVSMIGEISINQMPARLGKWINVVNEKGGQVGLEPKTTSRSLSLLIGLLPSTYEFISQQLVYKPVENYNATIFYEPTTGKIQKMVFAKKSPPAN